MYIICISRPNNKDTSTHVVTRREPADEPTTARFRTSTDTPIQRLFAYLHALRACMNDSRRASVGGWCLCGHSPCNSLPQWNRRPSGSQTEGLNHARFSAKPLRRQEPPRSAGVVPLYRWQGRGFCRGWGFQLFTQGDPRLTNSGASTGATTLLKDGVCRRRLSPGCRMSMSVGKSGNFMAAGVDFRTVLRTSSYLASPFRLRRPQGWCAPPEAPRMPFR